MDCLYFLSPHSSPWPDISSLKYSTGVTAVKQWITGRDSDASRELFFASLLLRVSAVVRMDGRKMSTDGGSHPHREFWMQSLAEVYITTGVNPTISTCTLWFSHVVAFHTSHCLLLCYTSMQLLAPHITHNDTYVFRQSIDWLLMPWIACISLFFSQLLLHPKLEAVPQALLHWTSGQRNIDYDADWDYILLSLFHL